MKKALTAIVTCGALVLSGVGSVTASAASFDYYRSDSANKTSCSTYGYISDIATLTLNLPIVSKQSYTSSGNNTFIFNKKSTNYTCSIPTNGHTISLNLTTFGSVSFSGNAGVVISSGSKSITYGMDTKACEYVLKGSASRIYSYTQKTGIQYTIKSGSTSKATVILETEWSW